MSSFCIKEALERSLKHPFHLFFMAAFNIFKSRSNSLTLYICLLSVSCDVIIFQIENTNPTENLVSSNVTLSNKLLVFGHRSLIKNIKQTAVEFATKKSHFIFDGQYNDQIDGVAMGSPLGPILANIFMCDSEENWIINSPSFHPTLSDRYVDDTFSMFESKDTAKEFLKYLNGRHNTIEFEQAEEIPFLDILVKRCPNNTFVTSVYRNKTFTGLYTKWDSFTPRKYKVNLNRTLTYRCFRICSNASLVQSAVEDLKRLLLQNGYPQGIITFNINDVLNKNKNKPNEPVATVPKKVLLVVFTSRK